MTNVAIGFCLQIFLLDVVRMEAFFVSLILFLSRAWDAVTDPLVGYLVSRTPHTPIGKLHPWMVISTPLGILSYVLLWLVPNGSDSLALSVPWYLVTSFMFETFMSCYHVPYTSLSMFLGGHQRDRDSATAYRMCLEMLSMLLSSVVQGQVMKVFYAERDHVCLNDEQPLEQVYHTPAPLHPALPNTIAAAVSVPLWQVLLVRVGKRIALLIGLPLFIPAVIVLVCVPSNLAVYMAMSVLCGSSLATLFLLPWSMLPDVVDDFTHKNPSCREMEPLFFSCYVFCNKLGGGLSIGFSTLVLHFAGYKAGACSHGDGVITALQVLFAPVPIVLLLLGLVFFYLYPIDETQQRQSLSHQEEAM
ncbi:hypothetical protein ACEWY4_000193 [Coilia grayii]|uniref:Uncharacterized protein n=1 Tax=Coilia grayii TaxID=363190 RepID=A0ABD1KVY6_9TELE